MDYDLLSTLRRHHPAWRLLAADTAPFVIAFLYDCFIRPNVRALSEEAITPKLEDHLHQLRERLAGTAPTGSAREYLHDWADNAKGWLRRYYPLNSDEPYYDLTPAAERAIHWLTSLEQRQFIGAESRLKLVFELLRQIAEGSETDPQLRIAELTRRRELMEAEIDRIRAGQVSLLDPTQLRERFLQAIDTARALLADFRQPVIAQQMLDAGVVDVAADALFEQFYVDKDRLRAPLRRARQTRRQISLTELLDMEPLAQGLAELVAWLSLATGEGRGIVDEREDQTVTWEDATGSVRRATLPQVVFVADRADVSEMSARTVASARERIDIDLFNQTVSMKSVGNLTDFVRGHMLEAFPVEARIEALLRLFDDLNRAHEAVLKAKAQIAALEPLVADARRHAELAGALEELRSCREALRPWFAELKSRLLVERIARLDAEIERSTARVDGLTEHCPTLSGERDQIRQAISDNGGDRIERLKNEIANLEEQHTDRRRRANAYAALARQLTLPEASDAAGFSANRRDATRALAAMEDEEAEVQNRLTEAIVSLRGLDEQLVEIQTELTSLRGRRSNIPAAMLALRERLCAELGLVMETLPFVGELLQVRDEDRDWEGAIERRLHNFGLSLLVPDAQYRAVAGL